jgi:predicted dehydrogenase
MRTVNAIIVGAGGFARQHIHAMPALRRTTAIVGLVEPSEKSRAATAIAAYAQQHWKAGTTGTWRQNPAIPAAGSCSTPART